MGTGRRTREFALAVVVIAGLLVVGSGPGLRSVTIVARTARVDFADLRTVVPGASTSCGSARLLARLDATVTRFPRVDRAVDSLEGDVPDFYEWLQLVPPPR
jgi:hypothetical protein